MPLVHVLSRNVRGGSPTPGGGGAAVVEAPLYTLPHKENGDAITWNTTTDAPAEDMWDFRTVPSVTGTTHNVTDTASWNTAVSNATYGDCISIAAGTVITGSFTIPNKSWSSGWITVRTANHASLPGVGSRIAESDNTDMATIRSTTTNESALTFAASASHWRFIGIIVTNESGATNQGGIIDLTPTGGSWTSTATAPNNIVFDRCWIKGQTAAGEQRHGAMMGGANIAFVDSRFTDIKENGGESHAIWGGNYLRRLHVDNCYIEADGINVFFGGATPTQMSGSYSGTAPQDIMMTRCELTKDLARYPSSGTYKNLFETKNSQYGLIWGCVWHGSRSGDEQDMVMNFNTANQDLTGSPLSDHIRGAHWTVRSCAFYDCEGDIFRVAKNLTSPYPGGEVTETLHHIAMEYCLVYDPPTSSDPSPSFFQMASVDQVPEVAVRNCTVIHSSTGGKYVYYDSDAIGTYSFGHRVYNNAFAYSAEYGFFTADVSSSTALDTIFGADNWRFDHNYSISGYALDTGGTPDNTGTNTTLANLAAFGFTNTATDDYSLAGGSPLLNAGSDGRDIGVQWSTLQTNISGVVTG